MKLKAEQDELAGLVVVEGEGLDGVVIDLRDNPGGLLEQAVKVANLWLDDGLIVYTQGRDGTQRAEFQASAEGTKEALAGGGAGERSTEDFLAYLDRFQMETRQLTSSVYGSAAGDIVA